MRLASTPEALICVECGEGFEEGYLPAVDRDGAYEPRPDDAVCTACGFNEVGYAGCAPEVDDVVDLDEGTILLHVSATSDDIEVRSVTNGGTVRGPTGCS